MKTGDAYLYIRQAMGDPEVAADAADSEKMFRARVERLAFEKRIDAQAVVNLNAEILTNRSFDYFGEILLRVSQILLGREVWREADREDGRITEREIVRFKTGAIIRVPKTWWDHLKFSEPWWLRPLRYFLSQPAFHEYQLIEEVHKEIVITGGVRHYHVCPHIRMPEGGPHFEFVLWEGERPFDGTAAEYQMLKALYEKVLAYNQKSAELDEVVRLAQSIHSLRASLPLHEPR